MSKLSLQEPASERSRGFVEFMPWRTAKTQGIARIKLPDASVHLAELHWYEASGIGRKEFKIKKLL